MTDVDTRKDFLTPIHLPLLLLFHPAAYKWWWKYLVHQMMLVRNAGELFHDREVTQVQHEHLRRPLPGGMAAQWCLMSRAQAVWSTGSTNISALLSFSMLSTSCRGGNYKYISEKGDWTKLIRINVSERCIIFSNPGLWENPPLSSDKDMYMDKDIIWMLV